LIAARAGLVALARSLLVGTATDGRFGKTPATAAVAFRALCGPRHDQPVNNNTIARQGRWQRPIEEFA